MSCFRFFAIFMVAALSLTRQSTADSIRYSDRLIVDFENGKSMLPSDPQTSLRQMLSRAEAACDKNYISSAMAFIVVPRDGAGSKNLTRLRVKHITSEVVGSLVLKKNILVDVVNTDEFSRRFRENGAQDAANRIGVEFICVPRE